MSITLTAMLLLVSVTQLTALADPGEGPPPTSDIPQGETLETTSPAEIPTPPPSAETPAPAPTPMRPLPDWLLATSNWPSWLYTVDEFPEWFYELEEEPVWFREVDRIPPWFFQIEEIPDWFYSSSIDEPAALPDFPDWMYDSLPWPSWIYAVDDFPEWFFELEREPVWFRQFDNVPGWFYTITEIPDWFYIDDEPGEPADDPTGTDEPQYPFETSDPFSPDDPLGGGYLPDIDDEMKYFVNLGNDLVVFCNVPNGMTTNSEVLISFPVDSFSITRDDDVYVHDAGQPLTEHGYYILAHIDNPAVVVYSFRIVTRPLNDMTEFTIPNGFVLTTAFFGNEMFKTTDSRSAPMDNDGDYRFIVSDDKYETSFIIEITLDTAPPQLVFTNRPEDGSEPVVFEISPEGDTELIAPVVFYAADGEENCDVLIMLNASSARANNNTLLEPGVYRITITDTAGNSTLYTFRILYIVTVPLIWVIVIGSLLIIALGGYLMYNRKHIRVR